MAISLFDVSAMCATQKVVSNQHKSARVGGKYSVIPWKGMVRTHSVAPVG